jgi:PAS domain S-box-containing protein
LSTDPSATPDAGPLRPAAAPPVGTLVDALFGQAPYSVALYDRQGRVAAANGAYERHWGIRLTDVPPDYSLLTDPQLREAGLLEPIGRAYAGEVVTLPPIRYDAARATGGAGRSAWTQGHCFPVRDADGAVAYVAVVHTDVTERVEIEAALRAANGELEARAALLQEQGLELELSNQQLQDQAAELEAATDDLAQARDAAVAERERLTRIVAQLPVPVAVLEGPELRFRALSEAYRQIIGGRAVAGKPIREVLPELSGGEGGVDFFALLEGVYATGEAAYGTGTVADWDDDGDGIAEHHIIDLVYAPLRGPSPTDAPDAPGPVEGVTALVLDVTARARAETALRESEARFRNMADAAPVMLWVTEPDGRCTFLNRAWLEFTGQTLEEGLGLGWLDVVHPEDRPRAERNFTEANARRAPFRADYRLRRHDGVYRWAVDAAAPRLGPAGEYLGYVGSVLDIDERTQLLEAERAARRLAEEASAASEALRGRAQASEALARQLFALSPLPKWVYDAGTLAFLDVNEAAARQYGYSREEFLAMTIRDIRPPEEVPLVLEAVATPQPVGGPRGLFHHRTKSGEIIEVEVYSQDIEYAGRRAGIVVARDVTERRRAEAALIEATRAAEAARDEADAANRAKSEFLATMSHELRTPLNAIGGYAELLEMGLRGPVTAQQREDLARIQGSGRHLLALINDILDLSRIDAGEMRVAREDAVTATALRAALDLTRVQAEARGVALVDARAAADVPYVGDDQRVRQVLTNLLSNAIKFTNAGGRVTVTDGLVVDAPPAARVYGRGPWAYVRVEDTGIGIAPDAQARIFEPFVQVDQTRTRTVGGSGLGLAISRRLARLMGGDLTVESTPEVGSTFTLWLPAPDVVTNLAGAHSEAAADRGARAERQAPPLSAPGLDQIAEALRASVDEILAAYADRLRSDPTLPWAREMRRTQLEDHAVSFLADLAQSLVIVADAGPEASELLRDGSAIQRTIAEHHGARRHAQGWTEEAVRRDHEVLRVELERAVRGRIAPRASGAAQPTAEVEEALALLLRLVDRAEAISVLGWRAAARG